ARPAENRFARQTRSHFSWPPLLCDAICAKLARQKMPLAEFRPRAYMLAQASIVPAIIVPARNMVMRPYYRKSNYTMANSVGYLMRMAVNRVLPQMEALFEDQELTFSQWTTLVALHDGRISTPGDLAQNICHDAGSLTRLIDQMV